MLKKYSVYKESNWEFQVVDEKGFDLETFEDDWGAIRRCYELNEEYEKSEEYKKSLAKFNKTPVGSTVKIEIYLPDTSSLTLEINKNAKNMKELFVKLGGLQISELKPDGTVILEEG